GNGTFNVDRERQDYGDSFVKLRFDGTSHKVMHYFTPCNQSLLDLPCGGANGEACDLDLGSSGPLLIEKSHRVIGGGKDGFIYVLNLTHMGHYTAPPQPVTMTCRNPAAIQTIVGGRYGGEGVVGHIHGSHVFWAGPDSAHVYIWGEEDSLRSYRLTAEGTLITPPAKSDYE